MGKVITPFGTEVNGFEVTIGGGKDSSEIERRYDDIQKIFKSNPSDYKVHEERSDSGTFKKFIVET